MSESTLLSIDYALCHALGKTEAHNQLQALARSTQIDIDWTSHRMLLKGANLDYHRADPYLMDNINSLPTSVDTRNYADYRQQFPQYDLCLEDSWSGYFTSLCLQDKEITEPVTFIHLDDHTDMMSTLLTLDNDTLYDPGCNAPFDPSKPESWNNAIKSGAIGIGSFVTALYYLPQIFHVMHINHNADSDYIQHNIYPHTLNHSLLHSAQLADISRKTDRSHKQLGTYTGGSNIARLLETIPEGKVIVHIDLDYFINDYNGNIGTHPTTSVHELRATALRLIDTFFHALNHMNITVERYIIATSPGFCSARHWKWLLEILVDRINDTNQ